MKRINKFALFILGALSFASCSDINDIESGILRCNPFSKGGYDPVP